MTNFIMLFTPERFSKLIEQMLKRITKHKNMASQKAFLLTNSTGNCNFWLVVFYMLSHTSFWEGVQPDSLMSLGVQDLRFHALRNLRY